MGKKAQRVGILIITIVTVVGTIGSFGVMVMAQKERSGLQSQLASAQATYQKERSAYQAKVDAQSKQLSDQYYGQFIAFKDRVGKFDIDSVKSLQKADLVAGSGADITDTTNFSAYYIGWDATGNVFDQSIDASKNQLKAPFAITSGLKNTSVIDGWKEGLTGMKIGGVRELTIPSDKAYGQAGSNGIPANMPLKFVVMAIETPPIIPQTPELQAAQSAYLDAYTRMNQ